VDDSAAVAIVVASFALVPVLMFAISRFSGWALLAERYPLYGAFPKPKVRLGYGVFRGWVGYNGGIIVGADPTGLYLRAMPVILSFCHAPIHVPWGDVTEIEPPSGLFGSGYRIRTVRAREVDFALRAGTFAAIREDARQAGVPGRY
jgi:hypothetical protein